MSSDGVELLVALATALAAGFLVGAEREQGNDATWGGIRTFPLVGLAGAVSMILGWWAVLVTGLAVGGLLVVAYYRDSQSEVGLSTETAAVIIFGLGALCTARDVGLPSTDRLLLVAAGATATLGLLSVKKLLHELVRHVSEDDIYATTKLLVLAVVFLPVLPNREMGPWQAFNPRSIGVLVVLISGIGFAGYVAIRALGPGRGLGLTGLLGGLASSTAVTLTFSGRAKEQPKLVGACAVAIALASATMFPRLLLEVWAVSAELAQRSLMPLAVTGSVALAAAGVLYFRVRRLAAEAPPTELSLKNPFSLSSAFKFSLLFIVVILVSRAGSHLFADAGVYLSAFLAGLADADAVCLSIARMFERGEVSASVAERGIAIAAATNTISKVGIATFLGGTSLGVRVLAVLGLALLAGATTLI